MKPIHSILISLTALILTSCFSSNDINVNREDVLGSWKLSVQSLKKIDVQKESNAITSFHLNADSTATFYLVDSSDKKVEGTWTWNNEKKTTDDNFGVGIENNVMIYSENLIFGLILRNINGGICLTMQDATYEKQ